jgi:hypothetical protein
VDLQQFVIHPIDAYGGSLLEVTGILPSVPLVNPNDVVQLQDQWCECLIAYAKVRLLLKDAPKAFADAVATYKPFQAKIREASIWHSIIWPDRQLVDQKQRMGSQEQWSH